MTSLTLEPPPLGWFTRRTLVMLAIAVSVGALVVPAVAYMQAHEEGRVLSQLTVPPVSLRGRVAALARTMHRTSQPVPLILAYHDVRPLLPNSEPRDIYTVTPEQFASHMAALHSAGFHTISSAELAGWLAGHPLPRRSVYITFDDGPTGLWRYADHVLRRYHFHAAVFVITGRPGTHRPYYLNWTELHRMARSGRWDIESHTRSGHGRVAVDASGRGLPFLINRAWLPRLHRPETLGEAVDRVKRDLKASRVDLIDHGLGRPQFFAYPFSAETKPTNDERMPPQVADVVRHTFAAGVSNDQPDRWASRRDRLRRSLSRLEVFRFTTTASLMERIMAARPLRPGGQPLDNPDAWVDPSGRRLVAAPSHLTAAVDPVSDIASWAHFDGGSLTATPDQGRYFGARYAPGRTEDWTGYRLTGLVGHLGPAGNGPTATLSVLEGSTAPVRVSVSAGYVTVRLGDRTLADHRIAAGDAHIVRLEAVPGRVTVTVDDAEVASTDVPREATGGIAVGATSPTAGTGIHFQSLAVDPIAEVAPAARPATTSSTIGGRTTTSSRGRTTTSTARPRTGLATTSTSSTSSTSTTVGLTSSTTTTAPVSSTTSSSTTSTTVAATTTSSTTSSTTTTTPHR